MPSIDLAHAQSQPAPDEIEPVAQRHATEAIETLVKQLLHGESESASVAAANALLDRGYGKPAADIGGTGLLPFLGRAPTRTVAETMREAAREQAHLAIATLRRIATSGRSESARVSAARSLLDRGLGAVAPAKVDIDAPRPLGKKEQAQLAANLPPGEESGWGDDLTPQLH